MPMLLPFEPPTSHRRCSVGVYSPSRSSSSISGSWESIGSKLALRCGVGARYEDAVCSGIAADEEAALDGAPVGCRPGDGLRLLARGLALSEPAEKEAKSSAPPTTVREIEYPPPCGYMYSTPFLSPKCAPQLGHNRVPGRLSSLARVLSICTSSNFRQNLSQSDQCLS